MNVWGNQVLSPTIDRALAAFLLKTGLMGRAERRLMSQIVAAGHCVVDVGANQGVFTLLLSRLVGPEGSVLALEPDPALFRTLEENCRRNDARNVNRLQAAAGEQRARGHLHRSRFNRGDNRLAGPDTWPSVMVDIVPLDDLLRTGSVDFVKIDVQGYELNVFRGMRSIVDRSPRIRVLFECWPAGILAAGSTPSALFAFFLERGFSLSEVERGGLRKLTRDEAARPEGGARGSWRNILAVRE